jgi:hypothetical protein
MFGRNSPIRAAERQRDALGPLEKVLGLELARTLFTPPETAEAAVLLGFYTSQQLLDYFSTPSSWPNIQDFDFEPNGATQRGAKLVRKALTSKDSLDALSWMTSAYGRANAASWRRAAASGMFSENEADALRRSAKRSDELADDTATFWPVQDPSPAVALIERGRYFREQQVPIDLDNPDARINLRDYFDTAEAMCGGAALLLGDKLDDELKGLLGLPLMQVHVAFSLLASSSWVRQLGQWGNLLEDQPYAYSSIAEREIREAREAREARE